jgi:proline iminopeptidase
MTDLALLEAHDLPVSGGHVVHVDVFGSAAGRAALVLHGGPGSGQSPMLRSGFDGRDWRVVCIDQRGCGASTPRGSVEANTTDDLISDTEQVRTMLGIDDWLVVGGSWGASLAIAYAAAHARVVQGLLLRSTFGASRDHVAAFFDGGPFGGSIGDVLCELRDSMLGDDDARRRETALAWWRWERNRQGMQAPPQPPTADAFAYVLDRYRVQSHYLFHDCWLGAPPLAQRCASLPRVPVLMIHGRADLVCPIEGARQLAAHIPQAHWREFEGVGHDPTAPAMQAAMREALAAFARDGRFDAAFTGTAVGRAAAS